MLKLFQKKFLKSSNEEKNELLFLYVYTENNLLFFPLLKLDFFLESRPFKTLISCECVNNSQSTYINVFQSDRIIKSSHYSYAFILALLYIFLHPSVISESVFELLYGGTW